MSPRKYSKAGILANLQVAAEWRESQLQLITILPSSGYQSRACVRPQLNHESHTLGEHANTLRTRYQHTILVHVRDKPQKNGPSSTMHKRIHHTNHSILAMILSSSSLSFDIANRPSVLYAVHCLDFRRKIFTDATE